MFWRQAQHKAVGNGHMQTFQLLFMLYNQYIYQMQQEHVNLSSDSQSEHVDNSGMVAEPNDRAQGRWEQDQHYRFLEGLFKFGKNWKEIQLLVATRVCSQVRSHAQKYFIKLQKIIKDRKKQKNKLGVELTDLENEVLDRFKPEDVTDKTPQILVSLLQNSCLMPSNKNLEKKNNVPNDDACQPGKQGFKGSKKQKNSKSQEIGEEKGPKDKNKQGDLSRQNSRNESLIDSYHDQEQDESKSFFYRLVQHNVQHFRKGKDFSQFIDFLGVSRHHEDTHCKPQQVDSSQTTRNRRASFTLVDDQQNDERLKLALEKIKNGQSCEILEK